MPDTSERLAIAHAETKRIMRKLLQAKTENNDLRQRSNVKDLLKLRAELASKTAECDVYRRCCWRAFQKWTLDHPKAMEWPDGALQIVEVMGKMEARIVELEARIG